MIIIGLWDTQANTKTRHLKYWHIDLCPFLYYSPKHNIAVMNDTEELLLTTNRTRRLGHDNKAMDIY